MESTRRYKFADDVLKPIYGLSEATAIATATVMGRPLSRYRMERGSFEIGQRAVWNDGLDVEKSITFIGVGKALTGNKVGIADDAGNMLPEHTIGHVMIKGGIVTGGYYKSPEETKEAYRSDGWLKTGDIGFLNEGELVVVGRQKEIIVVNGLKYTCNVIEDMLQQKISAPLGQAVVCTCMDSKRKSEGAVVFVQHILDFSNRQEADTFMAYTRRVREIVFENAGFMVDHVIPVDIIPKTGSGKVKRRELGNRFGQGEFDEVMEKIEQETYNMNHIEEKKRDPMSGAKVLQTVADTIKELFGLNISDYDLAFQDYGILSVNVPSLIDRMNKIFGINLQVASFFNNPSIRKFSEYIYKMLDNKVKDDVVDAAPSAAAVKDKIAIVGMSCRFPGGANSIREFWEILTSGRDGISDIPENRWKLEDYYDEDENAPGKMYCRKGGFLSKPVDEFDASFFNISPKEAAALDPQQRMLLELVWEAFENADIDITEYNGSNTGVYVGISTNEYMLAHAFSGDLPRIDAYSLTGASTSTACGRISYTFGFEGPSLTVDTACSSSLTALHIACQEIKTGETEMAVVGGANLMLSPAYNIGFSKLHATSPDGHSKSFDAGANGYGRGEGGGIILLKELSKAQRDNDQILGIICGTSINQDGKSNGLTAPNGASQAKLIERALSASQLLSTDVGYVEMHGTGTPLGDPIEVGSVVETYCKNRELSEPLRIGSVKSNIGHLEAAAGVASIIKVLLSFKNDMIPANLHFSNPNPLIRWDDFPVEVVGRHTEWRRNGKPRRAGINGFGFGGSNAHVILEEYQEPQDAKQGVNHDGNQGANLGVKQYANQAANLGVKQYANQAAKQYVNQDTDHGLDYIIKISAKSKTSLYKRIQSYAEAISDCGDE